MLANQHWGFVVVVINEGVVKAAVTRAWIEGDVGKTELLDEIRDDVGLPALIGFRLLLDLSHSMSLSRQTMPAEPLTVHPRS